jgi:hypothetical protein
MKRPSPNSFAASICADGAPAALPDQGLNSEEDTSAFGRIDRDGQPNHPRMGKLLLSLPCQKALPSAGRLDNPKVVVASRQAMAQRSVERISHQTVAHGVQAGQPRLAHTFSSDRNSPFMKAGCGKTARPVCAADEGQLFNGRLLRPDSWEADEQSGPDRSGAGGAKGRGQRNPFGTCGSNRCGSGCTC